MMAAEYQQGVTIHNGGMSLHTLSRYSYLKEVMILKKDCQETCRPWLKARTRTLLDPSQKVCFCEIEVFHRIYELICVQKLCRMVSFLYIPYLYSQTFVTKLKGCVYRNKPNS